jgi:aryl-alcohol dehydrogenase-like predicted oxidoreductase
MKRRVFVGTAFAAAAPASPQKPQGGNIPTRPFGKTGVQVQIIAQGGARMDLHPTVEDAAKHVRGCYDLGLRYFDCARSYWNGRSEEAYGIGLKGVRQNVFLTSKSTQKTRAKAEEELAASLKALQTDHLDVWQLHDVRTKEDIDRILGPGGAMEAFEAAKKAGKCRFIGFTGHFDPATHAAMLKAYDKWDSVLMPVHAADHAYLSFEQTALPVAVERGIGIQAIKVFCKAFLLRALNPEECLRYTLSMPVHAAVCGAGTIGQMVDNMRVAQSFKPLSATDLADVRKRAVVGQGVYTGTGMEYWKKVV